MSAHALAEVATAVAGGSPSSGGSPRGGSGSRSSLRPRRSKEREGETVEGPPPDFRCPAAQPPPSFRCPLSGELMQDAVRLGDRSFSSASLRGRGMSTWRPHTLLPKADHVLRSQVHDWLCERYASVVLRLRMVSAVTEIAAAGGVRALVAMLLAESPEESKAAACEAIWHLATGSGENRALLVQEGALPPVVALVSSQVAQSAAVRVLRQVAVDVEHARRLVDAGVIHPLLQLFIDASPARDLLCFLREEDVEGSHDSWLQQLAGPFSGSAPPAASSWSSSGSQESPPSSPVSDPSAKTSSQNPHWAGTAGSNLKAAPVS
ncbi:hypothetical protein EMIHUDRAFT_222658 [Emiliania huxleyi CCMP1516]|uniref:RING-type E3 ubiquitin transferase n=2 Tax=Emiliania huxleyi TaxID=2903 RepID=A0A0D3KXR6_EMIH1|nr:hypothetical protein EMIHUDRAFT_222658 [Emiliania huxleyi CCMP1516]EOD40551.1 hypothetical protein EMIHUDRAFT_222658 [Emiliania huxleyi CCMP1516]|eukprot:XP_005792980.1 hypothetical protein EMIHUDRAFT_222658 [Emiliania huxleyi CCMP1516]